MTRVDEPVVEGFVSSGFEPVREAFVENFARRGELVGACCVYRFGEKVDREVVADHDRLAAIMARQRPVWPPGERQAYHAISIDALMAPARPSRHGFHDELFGGPAKFSLGFMKPNESFSFGHEGAFGAPGAGGSMGYADPEIGIGYGYVTNRMGMELSGDARDVALRAAIPSDLAPRRSGASGG